MDHVSFQLHTYMAIRVNEEFGRPIEMRLNGSYSGKGRLFLRFLLFEPRQSVQGKPFASVNFQDCV